MSRDVRALVAQLDLDEKAALLAGADLWSTVAVPRLGIPSVKLTDGPNGARGPMLPAGYGAGTTDSTCMPSGAGLGATWDVELLERVGAVIGGDARALGCGVLLGPTVNLHRSPLGGRNFESYAEDPLLAGRLGAAWVRGAQAMGVVCTVKHFAGNESEDGRMIVDTVADGRTLRELHLLPFELAVKEGGALGIMTAYNRLNGHHCSDHQWLLTDVLRDEWGFEGFVVSDWFAFASTAVAIRAGLDLEMPGPGRAYGASLADAVRDGEVDEALVDAALHRLLGTLDCVGALDEDDPAPVSRSSNRAVAREAAAASMVLLHNAGVLPLAAPRLRTVAVIGPNAARAVIMGGGSSSLPVGEVRTPLQAIREHLGEGVEVRHEPGVTISLTTPEVPGDLLSSDGEAGLAVECFAPGDLGGEVLHRERFPTGTVQWFGAPTAGPCAWRATARLTVPEAGRWTLSLVQTRPARLLVDGEVVLDGTVADLPPGPDLFGTARREQTVDLDLTPDRSIAVEVQSEVHGDAMVHGAKLGLRPALPADAVTRAVDLARDADAVILVVGTDGDWETEGHDRRSLALPGAQDELIDAVLDVAPDAVVVVNAGSVVTMPWADRAGAVLQTWFGGIEMADALTEVLFGDREPGGRLPTTIPRRIEDNPAWGNFPGEGGRILYGERLLVGYRWYDARDLEVTFPFGHGLSYTTFRIEEPVLSSSVLDDDLTLTVQVPVTNTGARAGSEVVQVYVAPRSTTVLRPPKELKGFVKVHLEPGATAVAEITLDGRSFARWAESDPDYAELVRQQSAQAPWMPPLPPAEPTGWVVDAGTYDVHVARSAADIVHTVSVEVVGPRRLPA